MFEKFDYVSEMFQIAINILYVYYILIFCILLQFVYTNI